MDKPREAFESYYRQLLRSASDTNVEPALTTALTAWRSRKARALKRFPHTEDLAKEVRHIKETAVQNMQQLITNAIEVLQENGASVFYAQTNEDALAHIEKIIGNHKTIVAAKSITAEEMRLRQHLQKAGHEYWETDVGEFIQQLREEKPMHYAVPAIHIKKEEVSRVLSDFFRRQIPVDSAAQVAVIRDFLLEKYRQANVGICGCNALAVDTGTAVIIENEGNIRIASGLPPVTIVVLGIEKLVPTLHDAIKVAEVTWRYAGFTVPAYLNFISAPSSTADIEFEHVRGASGPKELHFILLDGGRSKLAKEPVMKEALYCLKCGNCLFECPVYQLTAGYYGGHGHFCGIGTIWNAYVTSNIIEAAPMAYTCLRCGRCAEICPLSLDSRKLVTQLRYIISNLSV